MYGFKFRTITALVVVLLLGTALPSRAGYADDRAEIENLMARYIFAMDWRDGEAYAETFTEDGILDSASGVRQGRAALATMFQGRDMPAAGSPPRRAFRNRHSVANIVIQVNGDTAQARAYWTAFRVFEGSNTPELWNYGHYEDDLIRKDGRWLFKKRVIRNEQEKGRQAGVVNPAREMVSVELTTE